MKYVPEIAFGIALSLLLACAVSCDGPPSPAAITAGVRAQLHANLQFAEASKRKHGAYPTELAVITDPWDSPYTYTLVNSSPRVCSLGPDRQPNTTDDICLP